MELLTAIFYTPPGWLFLGSMGCLLAGGWLCHRDAAEAAEAVATIRAAMARMEELLERAEADRRAIDQTRAKAAVLAEDCRQFHAALAEMFDQTAVRPAGM